MIIVIVPVAYQRISEVVRLRTDVPPHQSFMLATASGKPA